MLARAVVQVLNEHTRPERKLCSRLRLKQVHSAKKLIPNEQLLKYNGVLDDDGFKVRSYYTTQNSCAVTVENYNYDVINDCNFIPFIGIK